MQSATAAERQPLEKVSTAAVAVAAAATTVAAAHTAPEPFAAIASASLQRVAATGGSSVLALF